MLPCTFLGGLYGTTYIQYIYPYLYSTIVLLVTICYVPYIWEFIESSGIQAFRLDPGSEPYVGNINTGFAKAKIINLTMMCTKIPSG